MARQVVLDTNVVYSGLRSRSGASFQLLNRLGNGSFDANLSMSLVLEYQEVCNRLVGPTPLTQDDVDATIDYICRVGVAREVYYLWRPSLPDPKDEMVLEVAVASAADIVTFNMADFAGAERFGIRALTPGRFLSELGGLS